MSVSEQTTFTSSTANGVTTVFPYSFMIAHADDLTVELDGVVQTMGFTVSGVGDPAGGNVTFSVAPANGVKVFRYLDPVLQRDIDYQQFGDLLAPSLNNDFDRLWLALQAVNQKFVRALKLPTDTATDQVIVGDAAQRANRYLAFDSAGNLTLAVELDVGSLVVSGFVETLLDDLDAVAARETLGLVIGADVQEYNALTVAVAPGASGNLLTSNGSAWSSQPPAALADQVARDQIALTNMRLMLNGAVTSGALVQGRQWELSTDELGTPSTNELYVSDTINYYTPTASEYTPTGSTFGDMTANGGLAASFDGTTSTASASCSHRASTTSAYIGKAFSVAQNISRVDTYGSNNSGYGGSNNTLTFTVYGKNGAPSNATDGTAIGSISFTDADSTQQKSIPCNASTAYTHVWVNITGSSQNMWMAEVKYFNAPNDMTLIPAAATSVSSAPAYMVAYLLWKDDSSGAVLGTDLTVELSRDNGTNYTTATITNIAAFDGTYSILKARANVSGQPSGTSMLFRIKTLNGKAQRIAAPAIYAE